MSIQNPQSLEEWSLYVQSIGPEDITRKAFAANSMTFVEMLQEEGYEPLAIEEILRFFARRLDELDLFVPDGGEGFYMSYLDLLGDDE